MKLSHVAALVAASSLLVGCSSSSLSPFAPGQDGAEMKFHLLSGDAATDPAYLRMVMIDKTHPSGYTAQALPASWGSAQIRLHSTNAISHLTSDRTSTVNQTSFTSSGGQYSANAVVFNDLRPGTYLLQVTLFSGANATGTSVAVHTVNLTLAGGSATGVTLTMKTTDGTNSSNGGTVLNTTVNDLTGFIFSTGSSNNSVLGGPVSGGATASVIIAGDTLEINPLLYDSTATGTSSVTGPGGSSASTTGALDPGVLSRVVLSYANASTNATGSNLVAGETLLSDWVRGGNEPIRAATWASLAESGDGGSWPVASAASHSAIATVPSAWQNYFSWNTTTSMFTSPAPFTDESALSANYSLIYRYYDNTYSHNLIKIKTEPLAVVSPASINLTVQ